MIFVALSSGEPGQLLQAAVWITALFVATVGGISDIRSGKILNALTYPAIVASLTMAVVMGGWTGLSGAVAGLLVGAIPMLIGFVSGGVGGGDVKLMAALGGFLGIPLVFDLLVVSLTISALYVLGLWIGLGGIFAFARRIRFAFHLLPLGIKEGVIPALTDDAPPLTVPFGAAAAVALAWILIIPQNWTLSQVVPSFSQIVPF